MDLDKITNLVSTVLPYVVALAAIVFPAIQSRASRHQEKQQRDFNFYTVRRAEAIEAFLSDAAGCLFNGANYENFPKLWVAYGNASFYVSDPARQTMLGLCELVASKERDVSKLQQQYEQVVLALQSEPPRRPQ